MIRADTPYLRQKRRERLATIWPWLIDGAALLTLVVAAYEAPSWVYLAGKMAFDWATGAH